MLNESLIHLCDCTCLNMLHVLNYMLIKHKKIFECFSCFWKVFFILKIFKNFKNYATLFWRLASKVKPVACLSCELTQKVFATYQWVNVLVVKEAQKFFSICWVFRFLETQFGDLFAGGSSSHDVYSESFTASFVTCLWVDLPVTKNTQTYSSKFCLKGVWRLALVTCLRLNPVVKIACFA